MFLTGLVLSGVLVTYQNGQELGRERWRDDGKTLTSEISFVGKSLTVTIDRAAHRVTAGGTERALPPGTIALENGHWQAYALATEHATSGPVKVLLPSSGVTLDGALDVKPRSDRGRTVAVKIAALTVTVEIGRDGAVERASVPLQQLEVRREGVAPPVEAERAPPAGVVGEPVAVADGAVRGVLWRPASAKGNLPVALIVAGSGPTDRDGNNAAGLRTDCYRQLAEALAKAGVASVRWDKRGIGRSHRVDEATLQIGDYVDDAAAFVALARRDPRFGRVTVIGHSEGGLIALLLAQKASLDAVVLVATAGRPLADVLHEQLARQFSGAELAELDAIAAALRSGKPVARYPETTRALFRPSIERFLRSELALDPAALAKALAMPATIVQGETDAQVSVEDARRLAAAQPKAKLVVLPRVNHVLKEEATRALPQASYEDPGRPLGPGVVGAILAGVAR
jgi:pimeloyl-ACP methyl ester carboxylesterase